MRIRLKHERLAEAMGRSRRSQNGWAIYLGISPAYLSRLVNGKRPYPNPSTRNKLLAAFEMEFDDLFEIEPNRPPAQKELLPVAALNGTAAPGKEPTMFDLRNDFRFALRILLRRPLFAALVGLTLALGVGANVAVYSVIHRAYFEPLPFPESEHLAVLWNVHGVGQTSISPLQFTTFEASGVATRMGAFSLQNYQLLSGGDPLRVTAAEVTPALLPMLAAAPWRGQFFSPQDFDAGNQQALIISFPFFQDRFGGDENLLGQPIEFGQGMYRLAGVLPPDFEFPWKVDVFVPLVVPAWQLQPTEWGQEYLRVVARLQDQVSVETARARLNQLFEQRAPQRVARGQRIAVVSLRDQIMGESRPALAALFAASMLVFLIACSNVANLYLTRAEARREEFLVRVAMGASRLRVFRQLLSESVLLSLVGCSGGLLVAQGLLAIVNSSRLEILAPLRGAGLQPSVLGFGVAMLVLTCLVFGLVPTLQLLGRSAGRTLRPASTRGTTARRGRLLRRTLVAAEVALAIALAVAVALLLQSLIRLQEVDPGFRSEGILSGRVELPSSRYQPSQRAEFFRQLGENLAAHGEVEEVAFAYAIPFGDTVWSATFSIQGRPSDPNGLLPGANIRPVSHNYFQLMGIPLEEGRLFQADDRPGSPAVLVIDRVLADRYWPQGDAIGQQILDSVFGQAPATIVGIVGNVKDVGLDLEASGHLYASLEQFSSMRQRSVLIRTRSPIDGLTALLRREIQQLDPTLPVFEVGLLEEQVEESVAGRRLGLTLLAVFALVALLLAAVGVYGLTAYSVRRRTQEMGIRMALGAGSSDLVRMVLLEVVALWVLGAVAGSALAFVFRGVVGQFVFGVSSTDPASFLGVALLLGLLCVVAAALPARRAGRMNCLEALRYE